MYEKTEKVRASWAEHKPQNFAKNNIYYNIIYINIDIRVWFIEIEKIKISKFDLYGYTAKN